MKWEFHSLVCLLFAGTAVAWGQATSSYAQSGAADSGSAAVAQPPAPSQTAPDRLPPPAPAPAKTDGSNVLPMPHAEGSPAAPSTCAQPSAGAQTGPAPPATRLEDLRDDHQGPENTLWATGDYLLWFTKRGPLPAPIVTTGPLLGNPNTTELIGDSKFDYGAHSGGEATIGSWFDCRHVWGWEASGFVLDRTSDSSAVASNPNGNPLLAQPIANAQTSMPDVFLVSVPAAFSGAVSVTSSSLLWGAEANMVRNVAASGCFRADLLLGVRYVDLTEALEMDRTSTALIPGVFVFPGQTTASGVGDMLAVNDRFWTRNQFIGGQAGARVEYDWNGLAIGLSGKVAFGPDHEVVNATGVTNYTPAGATAPTNSFSGGYLVLPMANQGRQHTNWFSVVPELGVTLGYQITSHIRAQVGYQILYMSDTVRPGDLVNNTVNPKLVPSNINFGQASGLNQPMLSIREEDFWAQGLSAGITFSY